MFSADDIKKLWEYIKRIFAEEEIDTAIENSEFDIAKLTDENLATLSEEDLWSLFADLIYFVLNELAGGDFHVMHDVLHDVLALDEEVVDNFLDW